MKTTLGILHFFTWGYSTIARQITADRVTRSESEYTEHPVEGKSSIFKTQPNLMRWMQDGSILVNDFFVTNTTAIWTIVSQTGELTLQVNLREQLDIVQFLQTASAISIEPVINKNGINMLPFAFHVSSINQ